LSKFKEDIEEVKDRLSAWWDHEIIDRPCVSYWDIRPGSGPLDVKSIFEYYLPWHLAKNHDDIETSLIEFERVSSCMISGGDNVPRYFPNYGPGAMAAVLGIEPEFRSFTVWFKAPTPIPLDEIVATLEEIKINNNNPWFVRLKKITEFAAKRGKPDYYIAMTDLGGILDILSSFLGPEKLVVGLKYKPEIIDTCRSIILEKYLKVYDELQSIIERYNHGCSSWIHLWCPKRWYPLQCDISVMFSPDDFKRFVLPDLVAQAEHMDYAIYHLDGPLELKFVDILIKEPSITGIQWIPGAGAPPKYSDQWLPLYKKIQKAGKNLVIDYIEKPESMPHLYNELEPKGLFISAIILNNLRAAYSLPKFIGGHGAEGTFRSFRKEFKKRFKNKKEN